MEYTGLWTTPTLFSDFKDLNSTTIKLRVMTDEAVTNTRFYEGLHLPIDDPCTVEQLYFYCTWT
jgi:hypothetical protein